MIRKYCLSFSLSLVVIGCASHDARPANYAVRTAPGDRMALLDSAERALVEAGYSIASRDTAGGVIITSPMAIERTGERSLRADNPLRKYAEVRLSAAGEAHKVNCKVVIQEQATESFRYAAMERSGDDVPGHQTAIDRDAATTAAQNTVWRTLRRDRVEERDILDRIAPVKGEP